MKPDHPSGQLIKVGQGATAYRAFVPHPLPPAISPDWELSRHISAADRALSELAGVGRTMPNPHLLINPFIRREAVLSSRIEGTQANIAALYAYEAGQLPLPGMEPAPPESDVREVLNYVRALEYGLERLDTLPVSLFFLRGVAEQAQDAILHVKRLQDLQATWRERLIQARASALLLRLADSLFATPVLTIPEAQRLLGVTYHSARRNVDKLVKVGILQQVGESTYGKTYVAADILQAIGDGDSE